MTQSEIQFTEAFLIFENLKTNIWSVFYPTGF
ncbi:hypothetical protein bas43_0164 [Escherichia phage TadeuszReichstein]|nr:hypothetical protein bas43_0164 [Escherichia phage TadeuszReichstein]